MGHRDSGLIMRACVIMHNMIVEDEGIVDPDERFDYGGENVEPSHDNSTVLHLMNLLMHTKGSKARKYMFS